MLDLHVKTCCLTVRRISRFVHHARSPARPRSETSAASFSGHRLYLVVVRTKFLLSGNLEIIEDVVADQKMSLVTHHWRCSVQFQHDFFRLAHVNWYVDDVIGRLSAVRAPVRAATSRHKSKSSWKDLLSTIHRVIGVEWKREWKMKMFRV